MYSTFYFKNNVSLSANKEGNAMIIKNLDNKRVCDYEKGRQEIIIRRNDCVTIIKITPAGDVKFCNKRIKIK